MLTNKQHVILAALIEMHNESKDYAIPKRYMYIDCMNSKDEKIIIIPLILGAN